MLRSSPITNHGPMSVLPLPQRCRTQSLATHPAMDGWPPERPLKRLHHLDKCHLGEPQGAQNDWQPESDLVTCCSHCSVDATALGRPAIPPESEPYPRLLLCYASHTSYELRDIFTSPHVQKHPLLRLAVRGATHHPSLVLPTTNLRIQVGRHTLAAQRHGPYADWPNVPSSPAGLTALVLQRHLTRFLSSKLPHLSFSVYPHLGNQTPASCVKPQSRCSVRHSMLRSTQKQSRPILSAASAGALPQPFTGTAAGNGVLASGDSGQAATPHSQGPLGKRAARAQ